MWTSVHGPTAGFLHLHGRLDPVEAGAAVDRPVQARQERHQRRRAALVARHRVELTRRLALALASPVHPALVTALRLIEQAALGEERLLAGREHKVGGTITAAQRLVRDAHL